MRQSKLTGVNSLASSLSCAVVEMNSLFTRITKCARPCLSSLSVRSVNSVGYCTDSKNGPNSDYSYKSVIQNRNPRNMEYMGLAPKRIGWQFQYPTKEFYHKVYLEWTNTHITGKVEHASGKVVVLASTREWAIRDQLYSCTDVSAAENIGRVLAQRCLEFGLTHVFYDPRPEDAKSERMLAFLEALKEGNLVLEEPRGYQQPYVQGTDYDSRNRIGEEKKMQTDYQYE